MSIPVGGLPANEAWATLSSEAKHERILDAASRLFSSEGIDASMPAVAAAAGAGVASVYRQFASKDDLLAGLVTRRIEFLIEAVREAEAAPGERWIGLTNLLETVVETQSVHDFLIEALEQVSDHSDVVTSKALLLAELDRLVAEARTEGRLRDDATGDDLLLVFSATRAALQLEPHSSRRMLTLLIDGLATRS